MARSESISKTISTNNQARSSLYFIPEKIEGLDRYLEGGAEQLVIAQPADGGANLPFVDALAALEELLELIPHARWGVALPEEAPVESLL